MIDRDGIKWETIRSMLYYIFRNSGIEIKIITREQLSKDDQLQIIRKFNETSLGGHQGINQTFQQLQLVSHLVSLFTKVLPC